MSTPHVSHIRVPGPQINLWLVAVIGLLVALVALGATWVLTSGDTESKGLASGEIATMLDDRIVAVNSADEAGFASFYTEDAVLEERDIEPAVVTQGRDVIASRVMGMHRLGLRLASEGPPIQLGRYVAQAASVPGDPTTGWILVFELGPDGKIAHQWVIGGSP